VGDIALSGTFLFLLLPSFLTWKVFLAAYLHSM